MGPIEITRDNYSIVTMSETPVVVCLTSSSDPQGLKLAEAAKKLGAQSEEELLVATVNVEAQPSVAQSLGAQGPATVVIVQDGYTLGRTTAISGAQGLQAFVDKTLAKVKKAEKDQELTEHARKQRHWWHRL